MGTAARKLQKRRKCNLNRGKSARGMIFYAGTALLPPKIASKNGVF